MPWKELCNFLQGSYSLSDLQFWLDGGKKKNFFAEVFVKAGTRRPAVFPEISQVSSNYRAIFNLTIV